MGEARNWQWWPGRYVRRSSAGGIRALAVTPDGSRVVTASLDGVLRVWWRPFLLPLGRPIPAPATVLSSLAISADSRLVMASGQGGAGVWELAGGRPVGGPVDPHPYMDEQRIAMSTAAALSPDGTRLVTGGTDGLIRVFDVVTQAEVYGPIRAHDWVDRLAITPDGRLIVGLGFHGVLRCWDLGSGAAVGGPVTVHDADPLSLAVTPDSTRAVIGGTDGRLTVLRLDGSGEVGGGIVPAHRGWVSAVAVTPDGSRIISGGKGGVLHVWDPATPLSAAVTMPFALGEGVISAVAVTPDGRRVVASSLMGGVLETRPLPR